MTLDIHDANVTVELNLQGPNRHRLTIEYPGEPRYRERILAALADVLRPPVGARTAEEAE